MSSISQWSVTAASNNSAAPDGWPEGMAPSDVNDAARENMAAIRTFYNSIEWREWGHTITYGSATTFTTAAGDGDTTGIYHVGRRVHANGTTTGDIYGTVSASSHSGSTTVTVSWDSGTLQNEALTVEVGWAVDQFSGGGMPSGTKMVFYQASAPVGWTIDTGVDERFLIVDKDAGGTTGGTDNPKAIPVNISVSGTTGSESSHTHGAGSYTAIAHTEPNRGDPGTGSTTSVDYHTHAITGTSGAGSSHSHSFSDSGSDTLVPKYALVIVATKD